MSCEHEFAHLLPFFVSGALDDGQRELVGRHLATCEECRADLMLWKDAGEAVAAASQELPAPSPAVLLSTLDRVHQAEQGPHHWAWQLVRSQIPLVQREIWLASALVMALGYLLALARSEGQGGSALAVVAPLVAAAGVAMIYGPENDPALELALATPTSPRQLLLARLVLVFGYDLILALVATVGLVAVVPPALLGTIALGWLGPMTFLSAMALALSLLIGTGNAVGVAFLLWLARWMPFGLIGIELHGTLMALADLYAGLWTNSTALLGLAAVLVAAALLLVGRREPFLPQIAG